MNHFLPFLTLTVYDPHYVWEQATLPKSPTAADDQTRIWLPVLVRHPNHNTGSHILKQLASDTAWACDCKQDLLSSSEITSSPNKFPKLNSLCKAKKKKEKKSTNIKKEDINPNHNAISMQTQFAVLLSHFIIVKP